MSKFGSCGSWIQLAYEGTTMTCYSKHQSSTPAIVQFSGLMLPGAALELQLRNRDVTTVYLFAAYLQQYVGDPNSGAYFRVPNQTW